VRKCLGTENSLYNPPSKNLVVLFCVQSHFVPSHQLSVRFHVALARWKALPCAFDKHGKVIDGEHRLVADANWPKMKLEHVESQEDTLMAILISNVCRRNVSATEKSEILQELEEIHVKAGVKPETELARKISEETCMSYRWIMKYLPDNSKERPGLEVLPCI
jgi:hypothetical protein